MAVRFHQHSLKSNLIVDIFEILIARIKNQQLKN